MTKDGTVRGPRSVRPTGIIRTLPSLYGYGTVGAQRLALSLQAIETGKQEAVYIALPSKPKIDVLHLYLIVGGEVIVRFNIAGYEPGSARECWDATIRTPKYWAICTGPLSRPPERMLRRGFQGIRYTEELW